MAWTSAATSSSPDWWIFQVFCASQSSKSSKDKTPETKSAILARISEALTMTQSPTAIVRVSAFELRRRFNEGRYWQRTQEGGDLVAVVEAARHPALPLANEPHCTWSQLVSYRKKETNMEVARVHQYLRPDGSLGLSGRPDPKRLYEGGVLYRLKTAKQLAREQDGAASESDEHAPR